MRKQYTRLHVVIGFIAAAALMSFVIATILTINRAKAQTAEQGTGLSCDTVAQIVQYTKVYKGDVHEALAIVNKDEIACALVTIAFIRGEEVAKAVDIHGGISIVQVIVIGAYENGVWKRLTPAVQFIAVRVPGRDV